MEMTLKNSWYVITFTYDIDLVIGLKPGDIFYVLDIIVDKAQDGNSGYTYLKVKIVNKVLYSDIVLKVYLEAFPLKFRTGLINQGYIFIDPSQIEQIKPHKSLLTYYEDKIAPLNKHLNNTVKNPW